MSKKRRKQAKHKKNKQHDPHSGGLRQRLASLAKPMTEKLMEDALDSVQRETMGKSKYVYEIYHEDRRYVRMPFHTFEDRLNMLQNAMERIGSGAQSAELGPTLPALFGPLFEKAVIGDIRVYGAGLVTNTTAEYMFTFPPQEERQVLIDLARIAEIAIARVNLFRHGKIEWPEASIVIGRPGDTPNPKKQLKKRLGMVMPEPDLTETNLKAVMEALEQTHETDPIQSTRLARMLGLGVRAAWAKDDISHTVNLCNLLAGNALIAAIAKNSVEIELGDQVTGRAGTDLRLISNMKDLILNVAGQLAEIAYGDPFLGISTADLGIMRPPLTYLTFYMAYAMKPMLEGIEGVGHLESLPELHKVCTLGKEDWQQLAAQLLDEDTMERFGWSVRLPPGTIEMFEVARDSTFYSKESLPAILGVWKEIYQDK
jgi:hypothetical protein